MPKAFDFDATLKDLFQQDRPTLLIDNHGDLAADLKTEERRVSKSRGPTRGRSHDSRDIAETD
jgi:hypothetical protein